MIRPAPEAEVTICLMRHEDLAHVSDIERRSYDFPWSHGVFRDCLLAGYQCVVLERDGDVAGYAVLSVAAGEAHILNLCVEPAFRSHGYGERMLDEILFRARTSWCARYSLKFDHRTCTRWRCTRRKAFTWLQIARSTTRRTMGVRMPLILPKN